MAEGMDTLWALKAKPEDVKAVPGAKAINEIVPTAVVRNQLKKALEAAPLPQPPEAIELDDFLACLLNLNSQETQVWKCRAPKRS